MKRFLFSVVASILAVSAFAQTKNADEVKTTFSPRNLQANHTEFCLQSVLNQYNIEENMKGNISQITVSRSKASVVCAFNENNQPVSITKDGKEICTFVYNTHSQVEIAQSANGIVAITYDKKGRVASEAYLVAGSGKQKADPNSKVTVTAVDKYIYTDSWKKQTLSDSTECVYLFEATNAGKAKEWIIDRMYIYEYNGKGLMTKKIETARDKVRESVTEFKYKKGVLQQQVKTYSNTNLVESTVYTYEEGYLVKAVKGYFRDVTKRKSIELSSEVNMMMYDTQRNLVEYRCTDGHKYDLCVMKYDENQRLINVQKRQETGEMMPMFQCEYDAANMVSSTIKNEIKMQYTYEYDAQGNWITQTITKNGEAVGSISRLIQYK
ncbi:MAG: hypothetical protein J5588_05915 [Bacteroidales bacterium]|nr:hypothetical protein [Bacteroidales bacterium]